MEGQIPLIGHLSDAQDYIFDCLCKYSKSAYSNGSQVMSNQEAVDSIRTVKDARSAAKHLTDEALNRKSSDDISCIVLKF